MAYKSTNKSRRDSSSEIAARIGLMLLRALTADWIGQPKRYMECYNQQFYDQFAPTQGAMTQIHNHDRILEIYVI